MNIKAVIAELGTPRTVYVNSSPVLAEKVAKAAGKQDKKLEDDKKEVPRRKRLEPLTPAENPASFEVTPWEILHGLGRATVLTGQGASRGLAEHWGCLKYCQAMGPHQNNRRALALSQEGQAPVHHHKTVQSEELGIAFALAVATRVLERRLPGHAFTIIDADIALQAGWALGGRGLLKRSRDEVKLRPDYFIEARPPSGPSKVVVLECKGTHGAAYYAYQQLAKAASQVVAVHLEGRGAMPSLAVATELNASAGITMHVLDPDGDGTLDLPAEGAAKALNSPVAEQNIVPHFEVSDLDDEGNEHRQLISGFRIAEQHQGWFRAVLARTTAAGLMAFAGARNAAAPFLTKRQGSDRYTDFVFAGTGSVQDAKHRIGGTLFLGTDQVFRINGVRVEAFSGIAEPLFKRLESGDVASYRSQAFDVFDAWRARGGELGRGWDGAVSLDPDGSIMALRRLRR